MEWAIYNNEKIENTAHFMDSGYDTGPIIESESYDLSNKKSYKSIRNHIYSSACLLAAKVLKKINEYKITPADGLIQNEEESKYWKPISEEKFLEVLKKIKNRKYRYLI